MPFKATTPKCYPFDLPSLPELDREKARLLDQRDMQRFFYIEALLRSEVVEDLHRQATLRTRRRGTAPSEKKLSLWMFLLVENRQKLRGEANAPMRRLLWDESLRERFAVDAGWAVLLGAHHRYLRPRKEPFNLGEGIVDLSHLSQKHPDLLLRLKDYIDKSPSRHLCVMIDTAIVSSYDFRVLKEIVRQHQQQEFSDSEQQKAPHISDACAWLSYLHDYDLHVLKGLSLDQVGERTHGAPKAGTAKARDKRDNARRVVKRAVKNVKGLIASAEKGPWIFPRL
jgi:hypothetical protein